MIEVDGSFGEGGGQILRTLLTFSALTGTPFRLNNIRGNRPKPGLQRSHLSAVNAVASVCDASVKGNVLGSRTLEFRPSRIKEPLKLVIDVGTAGSATLILQSLIPLMIGRKITVTIKGGTDVPKSPTSDYMSCVFMGIMERVGIKGEIGVVRRGYYPRGGGEVIASDFRGGGEFSILRMGDVKKVVVMSHVTWLPVEIAKREAKAASEELSNFPVEVKIKEEKGTGKGTATLVYLEGESVIGADSLGAIGKRAEEVGKEAASHVLSDYRTGGAVDSFMGDMLMVYASLFGGEYKGSSLTCHAKTNAQVIKMFGVDLEINGVSPFTVKVRRPLVSGIN
ncbi:RNA 3'-terminal phosphate cyclase [Sulfuracidifex tepidarius]|uniref:RNA 3'-terminal phosphate cyclase n=1 Tax=Sulfuracidifex tepidarius TaxID=1294262 RepID=A0A510DZH2_9CREN|nr:RNA 3'-terminal phosphate cyclase [Sulfuracidifex tepidarius]BBG22895.1 RNA 3'-terminal phosphate cyclase [Sulfuracidifex tepidarius]BBG25656.1 RNA 3'-terminal phosphate cyclase [Sulfuracidifex tepidarius]